MCNCHNIVVFGVSFGIISSLTVLGDLGGEFGSTCLLVNNSKHSVCVFNSYEHLFNVDDDSPSHVRLNSSVIILGECF
ncbi:hypothetical protein Hanom_Chr00s003317g01711531 [Helianthus anomalus]